MINSTSVAELASSPFRNWAVAARINPSMATYTDDLTETFDEKLGLQSVPQKTNAFANKITSVLSTSYADSEIRDALHTLDRRNVQNTVETRRGLRLDVQEEVIRRNGDIIRDFGQVAEVRLPQ